MIEPRKFKHLVAWVPDMYLGGILPREPVKPIEYLIRNISKKAIMTAMVSSRSAIKGQR